MFRQKDENIRRETWSQAPIALRKFHDCGMFSLQTRLSALGAQKTFLDENSFKDVASGGAISQIPVEDVPLKLQKHTRSWYQFFQTIHPIYKHRQRGNHECPLALFSPLSCFILHLTRKVLWPSKKCKRWKLRSEIFKRDQLVSVKIVVGLLIN